MPEKSIHDFVLDDMWNHNLMSGDEIKGCVTGEKFATPKAKLGYAQGIFCTFPHMMLSNFSGWLWPEGAPKDYQAFMAESLPALQKKVFPDLERYYKDESLNPGERGQIAAVLLTRVIPQHILTGYYDYMFAGSEDYKDIGAFFDEVTPLLELTAEVIRSSFALSLEARAEAFLYAGARYPFLMLKRWYDWQFGKDVLEMGPPPAGGGGPGGPGGSGGPPPGGPGGPPPGGPPPM